MIDADEMFRQIATGERTLAEIEGLTVAEAYAIADYGWTLLEQGRADAAALIFETLVLSNPLHAYFQALHGAALQRQGAKGEALDAYARALALDPDETAALVNRAELLLERDGEADAEEVGSLLERALALDPDAGRPETQRARALVAALAERVV